jgi:hypothetical protein
MYHKAVCSPAYQLNGLNADSKATLYIPEHDEARRMSPYYGPAGESASEIALERLFLASGFNTNVEYERIY